VVTAAASSSFSAEALASAIRSSASAICLASLVSSLACFFEASS
jgi:hypothetical protein